jgi:hypothetical protein
MFLEFYFPWLNSPLVGQGLLIVEASRSHSDTLHLVGLLWTSDQPDAETSDITQHLEETNTHAPGGIRTRNPSQRSAADPNLRLLDHWVRLFPRIQCYIFSRS